MEMMFLPVLIPGLLGLLALALPARLRAAGPLLGTLGTAGGLAAGIALFDVRASFIREWLRLGPLNLDLAFRVDGFAGWAAAFIGLMGLLTVLYSAGWFRGQAPSRHYALVLLATSAASGVVLADNLLLLLLFWEIVTLALFLIVAMGRDEGALPAGKAFTIVGLGDMALLVGIVLLAIAGDAAGHARPLSGATLVAHPLATGDALGIVTFFLIFVGAAAKAGAIPVHSWIPTLSEGAHPSVMAFLPGSVDKVLGIYLLARLSLSWSVPSDEVRIAVMTVGAITILAAVLMALVQHDLRKLLAFHAVSQVGYMVVGIGTGTVVGVLGGIFHMLNHAIYKACLFMGAGMVEREAKTTRLDRLGGLANAMPVTMTAMLVAALAISGIPPLNGFVSKWLVYQGCVAAGRPIVLVVALFGSALTLASFVKVLHSVFWGPRPAALAGVREKGVILRLPLVVLATLCVLFGVFAGYVLDRAIGPAAGLGAGQGMSGADALSGVPAGWAEAGSAALAGAGGLPRAVYQPFAVTGLLVAGVLAGVLVVLSSRSRARRSRPVFIGGEALDPEVNRFPGTEFYRTIAELPVLRPALEAGNRGSFDLYSILERLGGGIVDFLRRLHTGVVTDYLVWCLLGLVALLGVFLWS